MQLAKHVVQGKLAYLSQETETITVSENEHYRWLAFSDRHNEPVIQSVMHKRIPWKLTLPHQTALMLPLLFFKPNSMVELGLGGGNIQRFIHHVSKEIALTSIEQSHVVIDCFIQYFNPQNCQAKVIHNDSMQWLKQNSGSSDWYICDVYQQNIDSYQSAVMQLEQITAKITANTCLSINIPEANDSDINLFLTLLKEITNKHEIIYFHIPNYLNIVIHLIPKQWQIFKRIKRNKHSYLANNTFLRWKKFWQHGKTLSG